MPNLFERLNDQIIGYDTGQHKTVGQGDIARALQEVIQTCINLDDELEFQAVTTWEDFCDEDGPLNLAATKELAFCKVADLMIAIRKA